MEENEKKNEELEREESTEASSPDANGSGDGAESSAEETERGEYTDETGYSEADTDGHRENAPEVQDGESYDNAAQTAEGAEADTAKKSPFIKTDIDWSASKDAAETPARVKNVWRAVISLALCAVFGFFGAVGGICVLSNIGYANSNSLLGNLIVNSSGLETHKVTVAEKDVQYTGGLIERTEALMPSVVEIYELAKDEGTEDSYSTVGSASGVILSDTGYIVTNEHVTDGVDKLLVVLSDGTEYDGRVIAEDSITDLAVAKIEPSQHPEKKLVPVTLGVSANLRLAQSVIVIGNPLGSGLSVSTGVVSATSRDVTVSGETNKLVQMTAAVSPGNSGGGMFDIDGNLIGIVNAKSTGTGVEGIGYAIPVDTVKAVVDELLKYGYVRGRAALGITVASVYDKSTYQHFLENDLAGYLFETRYGLYVISNEGTSDLKKGDRTIEIGGARVTGTATVTAELRKRKPGDTVTVKVQRVTEIGSTEFDEIEINVLLTERKPER